MDTLNQEMTTAAGGPGRASLAVTGEVDASNADRLRSAILEAAGENDAQLEVDLAAVTFMDSTGLRAIEEASRTIDPSGAGLVVHNVPRQVQRLLDISEVWPSLEVRR
jgi:anti-sigma B factor antagonist